MQSDKKKCLKKLYESAQCYAEAVEKNNLIEAAWWLGYMTREIEVCD